jgi:hypothetical protein
MAELADDGGPCTHGHFVSCRLAVARGAPRCDKHAKPLLDETSPRCWD